MHVFFLCKETIFANALVLFRKSTCLPPMGIKHSILPWVCWMLWTARNRLIFEYKTITPTEVAMRALVAAREWDLAQLSTEKSTKSEISGLITLPQRRGPQNMTTCKIDAAYDASTNREGITWIMTDPYSHRLGSGSQVVDCVSSPLQVEAMALRLGLSTAASKGSTNVSFLSDCSTLIRAILNKQQIKEIYGILKDINHLSSDFASIGFSHISRSHNRDADLLAKEALRAFSFASNSSVVVS